jgi:hypothetical protein
MTPVSLPFLFFGLFALVAVAAVIISFLLERRRREAFAAAATTEGWSYFPDKDRNHVRSLSFINRLARGDNRYIQHRFQGTYANRPFEIFEYHYQVTTGSGKNRRTTHYHFRVAHATLPVAFPELVIGPEGFFDKIAAAFGYDDIDFESSEFSRLFHVKSPDRKFAYDIIHPLMMEWLLRKPGVSLEIEGTSLAVFESGPMEIEKIHPLLAHLGGIQERLPSYLLAAARAES